jgi:hypothetical protein
MLSSGMLRHVALVRADVSEEPIASIIRVTRICVIRVGYVRLYLACSTFVHKVPRLNM